MWASNRHSHAQNLEAIPILITYDTMKYFILYSTENTTCSTLSQFYNLSEGKTILDDKSGYL